MNTTLEVIKQLRSETGAGVMECRKALEQADYDYTQATAQLRAAAERDALRRAARGSEQAAQEGMIALYSHNRGRIGVMVEINTETEFAARSEVFRRLASEIALHIAAAAPQWVRAEDIPPAVLDEQPTEAARAAFTNSAVLLRQPFIRDESITVAQLLAQAGGQIGEAIVVRRFARWEINPDEG